MWNGPFFVYPMYPSVHYLDKPLRFFYIQLNLIMLYKHADDKYDDALDENPG